MTKKRFLSKIAILCLSTVLFIGCQTVFDCIIGITPNLISKELAEGAMYQNYNDTVTFEMEHANTNDYYISDISTEGNLPPGIGKFLTQDGVTFSGIPTQLGEYDFTLTITVLPHVANPDGSNDMCGNVSSKQYKIIIH